MSPVFTLINHLSSSQLHIIKFRSLWRRRIFAVRFVVAWALIIPSFVLCERYLIWNMMNEMEMASILRIYECMSLCVLKVSTSAVSTLNSTMNLRVLVLYIYGTWALKINVYEGAMLYLWHGCISVKHFW